MPRTRTAAWILGSLAACRPFPELPREDPPSTPVHEPPDAAAVPFRLALHDGARTTTTETANGRRILLVPLDHGLVAVTWWLRDGAEPATIEGMDRAALEILAEAGFRPTAPPRAAEIRGARQARRVDFTFDGGAGLVGVLLVAVREPAAFTVLVSAEPEGPAAGRLEDLLASFEILAGVRPWT